VKPETVETYVEALNDRARRVPLVADARAYAHAGHDSIGQTRMGTSDPYWYHTDEVGGILAYYGFSDAIVAGGCCHDLLEDVKRPPYDEAGIRTRLGEEVTGYVLEVTDVYTAARHPHLNRAARKHAEHERYRQFSEGAHAIKFADIASNVRNPQALDPRFASIYAAEKRHALDVLLQSASPRLRPLAALPVLLFGYTHSTSISAPGSLVPVPLVIPEDLSRERDAR
jgi:(p)ppGpp synthase/HD superfamily hydrolase